MNENGNSTALLVEFPFLGVSDEGGSNRFVHQSLKRLCGQTAVVPAVVACDIPNSEGSILARCNFFLLTIEVKDTSKTSL
jgi:hypothetical protein